jgi:hypothetical protein
MASFETWKGRKGRRKGGIDAVKRPVVCTQVIPPEAERVEFC